MLVTDAHAMGSLGAIRSLGRAGYAVVAASDQPTAIGLRSSFATSTLLYPPLAADPAAFTEWLSATIARERISAVVPSEGVLLAIRDEYDKFSSVLPLSSDAGIVYAGMSKFDLFDRFSRTPLAERLPPYLLVEQSDEPPDAKSLARLGLPLFLKADAAHALVRGESVVRCCNGLEEAHATLARLRSRYRRVLIQGYVPGVGVGAFLLRWKGRVLGRFMHRRIHEVPHTGGTSSYRGAWWNDAIFADAVSRAEAMRWEGVAMFEYRWDPRSGAFHLLELNGRFWGSLHLALFAGVDFPRLLLDAFFGRAEVSVGFDRNVRSRLTPRDVEYVWSRVKDRDLALSSRLWSVLEFLLLGLDPRVHSDLNFPGDRGLYWHGWKEAMARWMCRGR